MTDKDASQISSFNVSAKSSDKIDFSGESSKKVNINPWVVLICFDGGFSSEKPERVTSASFKEFIEKSNPIISGCVKEGLPDGIEPFYVEYPISDLKDFSLLAISCNVPFIKRLKNAFDILDDIYNKKITLKDGINKIAALRPPPSILKILSELTQHPEKEIQKENKKPYSSKIDSILSMVEIPLNTAENRDKTLPAFNSFFDKISGEENTEDSVTKKILLCKDEIYKLIEKVSIIVREQPFFRTINSSWECLKTLLKIAGRNSNIIFYVYSGTYDAAERNLSKVLNFCTEDSATPDIIIWDYPVTTDTATMEQLEYIGNIVEKYKSLLLTSLYYNDALYNRLLGMEPVSSVLGENYFIPFRRLKDKEVSRSIALFAPDATGRKNNDLTIKYSGAWLFSFLWIRSFLETNIPFYLNPSSTGELFDGLIFPRISRETISDSYVHGINLLAPEYPLTPRVINDNFDSPYGNLFFNLIVNRTARLVAYWITGKKADNSTETTSELEQYLKKELIHYGILSTEDVLSVETTDQGLLVAVDSETKISNFNIKFQFSFG